MEQNEKKFYELTEEERKQVNAKRWKKVKPILKRILFGAFCIAVCVLMFFGLLRGMFDKGNNSTSETVIIVNNLLK